MRWSGMIACIALAGAPAGTPAIPAAGPAMDPPAACQVTLDIGDTGAEGAFVRAVPNGPVVTRLHAADAAVVIDADRFANGWFRVVDAWRYDYHQGAPFTTAKIYSGTGWIHASRLTVSLMPDGDAKASHLHARPDAASRAATLKSPDGDAFTGSVIGCRGAWVHVLVSPAPREGWSNDSCTGPLNPEPRCAIHDY